MRLRQIALVAHDLDRVVDDLCGTLGLEVGYHDPGVKVFGLHNAVIPLGDAFLEVVSPIADDASALRYLARRGGDSGYMVMVQSDDFGVDRARVEGLGVRIVWSAELPDISGMHLHPRDTGGALLSLDQPLPAEAWRWGGPDWQEHVRTDRIQALVGADIACENPARTVRRWAEILDVTAREEDAGWRIDLAPGVLRFVSDTSGRGDGLAGFRVTARDPQAVLSEARTRGLATDATGFEVCGVRVRTDG